MSMKPGKDHVALGVDRLLALDRLLGDRSDLLALDADVPNRIEPRLRNDHPPTSDYDIIVCP